MNSILSLKKKQSHRSRKGEVKAFCCWSGGKESSLSCYRAMQNLGVRIDYLLNMASSDGRHSRSHGVSSHLLKLQAEAMGIPLVQKNTTWARYEEEFKKAVLNLKREGIQAGVFGDIDLVEHREWVERVCKEIGIKPILPLWKEERENLLEEFIGVGFKAKICATRASFLSQDWLGREIDKKFIKDLGALGGIDLCGEKGEYHTFVYDGPIFKKPVEFIIGKKLSKDRYHFLELTFPTPEAWHRHKARIWEFII
jgi:uncharacterized protein (TIGR00290 family)